VEDTCKSEPVGFRVKTQSLIFEELLALAGLKGWANDSPVYTGESRLAGAAYTGESRLLGVAYTSELL
jgi:hypothetical protein